MARERLSLPATRAALRAGKPVSVMALGSSSTEGSGATSRDKPYPARLDARLHAALPGVELSVFNKGRGGEDIVEMLARLDRELAETRPTLVIFQAGANAALKGLDVATFTTLMQQAIDRIRATGADVVLMDNQKAPRILASAGFDGYGAALRQLAARNEISLFSRWQLMGRWEQAGLTPAMVIGGDGLHHNDRGYDCLSAALSESILAATGGTAIAAAPQAR